MKTLQANNSKHTLLRLVSIILAGLALCLLAFTTGGELENRDPFCASCHTQPESQYFERVHSEAASDLASLHAVQSVRCIDCHSGQGVSGRMGSILLGARDLTRYVSGVYEQPADQTRPIQDINCVKCHNDLYDNKDFRNHYHLLLAQWQASDAQAASCVSCHAGHDAQGDKTIGFLNLSTARPVCDRCHDLPVAFFQ